LLPAYPIPTLRDETLDTCVRHANQTGVRQSDANAPAYQTISSERDACELVYRLHGNRTLSPVARTSKSRRFLADEEKGEKGNDNLSNEVNNQTGIELLLCRGAEKA